MLIFSIQKEEVVPERTNFDFNANYTPNDGDWYAGVYGKNLADKRYC